MTPRLHTSRIGRRVLGLFILSALVPLSLCAVILFREFAADLSRADGESLDGVVRTFGTTLLGRLGSADDALKVIATAAGATDITAQASLSKLPWVRSSIRVSAAAVPESPVPLPDAKQRHALQTGTPALLWNARARGQPQIYLLRSLPSGAWLYAEIDPAWLWADASEFAGQTGLLVLDDEGRQLAAAGNGPAGLLGARAGASTPLIHAFDPKTQRLAGLPEGWMSRSWEVFLPSRFSAAPWRLFAVRERTTLLTNAYDSYTNLIGIILLTILLIAWLSVTSLRRQMRPLALLTHATRQVGERNFDAFRNMTWPDEFGDLARAFHAMSEKLKIQFAALETLADVDRLLLGTPDLDSILDTLLPRLAAVLRCDSVSVLLFDPDSHEHGRIYDHCASQPRELEVRRAAVDITALRIASAGPSSLIDVHGAHGLACLQPVAARNITVMQLESLRCDGECVGVLCLGYRSRAAAPHEHGMAAIDFADRLSLILANLKQSERLRQHANFDALTGLQNRRLFAECVSTAVAEAARGEGMGGLLYIDLDHFKRVNDSAGHAAGDALLCIVADRLTACIEPGAQIARLGGDEFAVLLPFVRDRASAAHVAERIVASLHAPITVEGREHHVSASVGITVFPADGTTLDELLRTADIAMYDAKEAGRDRAVFFRTEMQQKLLERVELESGMKRALAQSEFVLHFQPIVTDPGGDALGAEALIRWPTDDLVPWISPQVFIPIAEENGLIVPLGDWVLRSACRQFAQWRSAGARIDYVSVNVSVRELREPDYLRKLVAALEDHGMRGADLQIEITESVLAHRAEIAKTLAEVAALGVRLALDDFGTGYSSLSYLGAYPIHTVKIDRAFVLGLPADPVACRLVESIIVMCAALGKSVVAEGVETAAQREFLHRAGCTTLQGYLLGRPMEACDIPAFAARLRLTSAETDADTSGSPAALRRAL